MRFNMVANDDMILLKSENFLLNSGNVALLGLQCIVNENTNWICILMMKVRI